MTVLLSIDGQGGGQTRTVRWRADAPLPRRVLTADDTLPADAAYRMACEAYNEAIGQSPASWLALRLNLRPAVTLSFADRSVQESA